MSSLLTSDLFDPPFLTPPTLPDSSLFLSASPSPDLLPVDGASDTTSDLMLAQMLQMQFDREFDDQLRREERKFNGDNKGWLESYAHKQVLLLSYYQFCCCLFLILAFVVIVNIFMFILLSFLLCLLSITILFLSV